MFYVNFLNKHILAYIFYPLKISTKIGFPGLKLIDFLIQSTDKSNITIIHVYKCAMLVDLN